MASYLPDEMDQNFLDSITQTYDYCSTITCPDGFIQEETGFAKCNSTPCDLSLGSNDLDTCCSRLCDTTDDCDTNQVCISKNDIMICTDSCTSDNDCDEGLNCLDTDNDGLFYCKTDESKIIQLFNRIIFIIERVVYADSIIVDTIILIIFAYLISKFINVFNININIT